MSFRLSKKWQGAVVALALLGILALTFASSMRNSIVTGVFTMLERQPVLTLKNQSGEEVRDLEAVFRGGRARSDRLLDGESVTISLWIRGESGLTISWREPGGGQIEWILGCYLESITYDKISATIMPGGKVVVTDMSGVLSASSVAPATDNENTGKSLVVPGGT